jgi:Septum formation
MIRRMPVGVLVGIGLALVAGLAFLVVRGAGSRDAASLVIGDCFDVPAQVQRIEDLRSRACGGPHGGEVFHIYEVAAASQTYPTDAGWEGLIYPACDPAFEAYTGTPVGGRLDIGYLFLVPTADRWAAGDRRVTCFITSLDGSPLSRSFRAAP